MGKRGSKQGLAVGHSSYNAVSLNDVDGRGQGQVRRNQLSYAVKFKCCTGQYSHVHCPEILLNTVV